MPKKVEWEGNMGARPENKDNQSENFRKGYDPVAGAGPKSADWEGEPNNTSYLNDDNKSKSGGRA